MGSGGLRRSDASADLTPVRLQQMMNYEAQNWMVLETTDLLQPNLIGIGKSDIHRIVRTPFIAII